MITKAVIRYARISPRKVRPVIALIKGKKANEALSILFGVKRKASEYLTDLLRSAIANTRNMQGVEASDLYISRIIADGGPQMKRYRAASMGRAGLIRKRTSHITIVLDRVPQPDSEAASTASMVKKSTVQGNAGAARARKPATAHSKKSKVKESTKADASKKGKE